jgi:selenocysteine-specific elongation factor
MNHIIIGTAGHVDHGKTILIRALTGTDTDRLKEEKERGISIELGFAYMQLSNGQTAGIIDVPGHERFIKNMLAGVGGIDIVLLVIAADEGVMPQTREHLDIIQLLQIDKGIVVITKKDLVDQEWLELVYEEVKDFLAGTLLENAPILAVSAVTSEGMDHLQKAISQMAAGTTRKKNAGPTRLPVDRVFSVTGFGTVATGTLLSGQIHTGDTLQIYPGDAVYRVRNIQVHGHKVDTAEPGQRVAVNLSGAEAGDLNRGDTLASPGTLQPSFRVDVKLKLLSNAPKPLKHRARVRVYIGTAEILGRVILLDREELQPGDDAYVQLQLETKVAVARGDRFVIRSYSPMRTIGGGTVINPATVKHKRNRQEVIKALTTAEKGTPAELLEQHLATNNRAFTLGELAAGVGLTGEETASALQELLDDNRAAAIQTEGEKVYLATRVLAEWEKKITRVLAEYHAKYPLREGYPKEEMRSRLFPAMNSKQFQMLLNHFTKDKILAVQPQTVSLQGFTPQPTPTQDKKINRLEEIYLASPFQPPGWPEAAKEAGLAVDEQEYLSYLLNRGILVKITEGLYFHSRALQKAIDLVKDHLTQKGELSLGEVRDLLKTSRKYTLPLLEYLDRERITRRVGDVRVAGRALSSG